MLIDQLISQFKALADPVRLRIVALCARVECSVSELTKVMSQSQPRISQHLKQLCEAQSNGIVTGTLSIIACQWVANRQHRVAVF